MLNIKIITTENKEEIFETDVYKVKDGFLILYNREPKQILHLNTANIKSFIITEKKEEKINKENS